MPSQNTWTELHEILNESITRDGVTVTRGFRGPWSDRFDFAERLFSEAPVYTPIPDAQLSGIDFTPLECMEKNPGADVVVDIAEYDVCQAVLTYSINYGELSSDSDLLKGASNGGQFTEDADDGYYTIQIEGATVDYTLEGESWEWKLHKKAGLSVDTNPYIQIPTTNFQLSLNQAANPDWVRFTEAVKHVNQKSFTVPILGIRCPPETMLFDSYRNSVQVDKKALINRTLNWKVDFDLKLRMFKAPYYKDDGNTPEEPDFITWNHFWNDKVKVPAWEYVQHPSATQRFESEIATGQNLTPVPVYPFGRVF